MGASGIVGQVLDGKYSIEKLLGKGGMGSVYLATHIGTDRPVAVKVIAPEFMQRAEFVERFRREAKAAGRLRHPNVVNVTDFGFAKTETKEDVAYLIMEYLDGCTLGEVLDEEKQLPVSFSIDILEQVCSAVEEAHKQGIIHRDLKPDNVWLEPNQRGGFTVKVLDFGIAKLEAGSTVLPEASAYSSDHSLTQINKEFRTLADPNNSETLVDGRSSTFVAEGETIAHSNESKTLVSEGKTVMQDNPLESKLNSVDSEGGTSILSSRESKIDEAVDAKGTKLIPNRIDTDKSLRPNATSDLTRVGAVLGTPLYMSPEQCRGEKLSASSDIYSLAVMAYQMLAGKLPFEGDYLKVMEGHKNYEPPPLVAKQVPKKLKGIVMQSLAKEPGERPVSAQAFSSKVRSSSEGLGVLLRRAIVIYSEHLPKFLLLAFLTFLPVIFLTFLRSGINFLAGIGAIELGVFQDAVGIILAMVMFLVQIVVAALLVGMTTWIVAQKLALPLRPVNLRAAFYEVKKRWKPLIGTVTLSTFLSLLGFALCLLPGVWLSAKFMLIAPSIVMEGVSGKAAFRRSMELTKRSMRTVLATTVLVYIIPGILAGAIGLSVASVIKNFEMSSEMARMKKEGVKPDPSHGSVNEATSAIDTETGQLIQKDIARQFTRALQESIFDLLWTPLVLIISSFTSIVTALIYFKTRQAGGESMQDLLGKLDDADRPQSKWRQRVRKRLMESGKVTGDSAEHA